MLGRLQETESEQVMALTRKFADTVKARASRDAAFRLALLREAMDSLLEGDVDTGKTILRDYINATMGFEALAIRVKLPSKSLHRMLGPRGNPRANNLFRILAALQGVEHVGATVQLRKSA
jgi:DNA-binding phage protein